MKPTRVNALTRAALLTAGLVLLGALSACQTATPREDGLTQIERNQATWKRIQKYQGNGHGR